MDVAVVHRINVDGDGRQASRKQEIDLAGRDEEEWGEVFVAAAVFERDARAGQASWQWQRGGSLRADGQIAAEERGDGSGREAGA